MRIRSAGFIVIVILWMMLSPVGSAGSFHGDSEVVNDNPEILSVDEYESNLTWTSRTEHAPQLVENYSNVAGDHVIMNGTFSELLNVTECVLTIWNPETGINATVSNVGSNITFDTYYLDRTNQTYNIIVNGTTDTNDFVIIFRENVTICNFFSPNVIVNAPVEVGIDSDIWNLTWSCTDANADDTPYYSVWLSRDSGVSFVLLTHNISSSYYIWDSTTWLMDDYSVRIRAYSVDMTSNDCSFENPPESYWPGDYTVAYSAVFHGDGPPPVYTNGEGLDVDSVSDMTYEFGSTGNTVRLYLRFLNAPSSVDYIVRDNGTVWFEGDSYSASSVMVVVLNIDGLSLGPHEIEVDFLHNGHKLASFTVNVIDSYAIDSSQLLFIAFSISIGIFAGVVVLAVYVKKLK